MNSMNLTWRNWIQAHRRAKQSIPLIYARFRARERACLTFLTIYAESSTGTPLIAAFPES